MPWRASSQADRTDLDRRGPVGDRELAPHRSKLLAQPGHPFRRGGGHVGFQEKRVAEGHFQVVEPVTNQRLQRNGIDIMGLDPLQHLVVEVDRLLPRQPQQDAAKARVLVAPDQLVMDLAEPEPAAELGPAGPALQQPCGRSRWRPPSCARVPGRALAPSRPRASSAAPRLDGRR